MRKLAYLFVATAFAASSAWADAPAPEGTTVQSAAANSAAPEQVHQLEGVYSLSNGRILHLTAADERLHADFDGNKSIELVPVGENRYASKDGAISVAYKSESDIAVSYAPDLQAARPAFSFPGKRPF